MNYKGLFRDFTNYAGADCAATFADRKAKFFFHRDWHDKLDVNVNIIARHNHFSTFVKRHNASHISCTEVELRTVVVKERRMTMLSFASL